MVVVVLMVAAMVNVQLARASWASEPGLRRRRLRQMILLASKADVHVGQDIRASGWGRGTLMRRQRTRADVVGERGKAEDSDDASGGDQSC